MAQSNFNKVKIIKANDSYGSENKATGNLTTSQASYFFGANNDLWSESWSNTDINHANFGVAVAFQGSGYTPNRLTYMLKATNFGFSIPGGATIDGIYVEISGREASGSAATKRAEVFYVKITVYYTEAAGGTNMQVNIGDVWKEVPAVKINIGDVWKDVAGAQVNIGNAWKTIF